MDHMGVVGLNNSLNQTPVTNINASSYCSEISHSANPFFIVVCGLVFLVGLVLNSFTLKVYFCRARKSTSSSVRVYLKNLAASDFFLSLCLPLRIAHYASDSEHIQMFYCTFGAAAFYLNMYASIMFMEYVAANRYLKIVHPLGTHVLQRVRAAHTISIVTWVFLLATMGLYITLSLTSQHRITAAHRALGCVALHSTPVSLLYKILHSISAAIFLLVLVSLIYFYYATTRRLRLAQRNQPRGTPGCKRLSRSCRNMLVLVSVFCICFVPYHLVRLPYAFIRDKCASGGQTFYYLKELSVMLSILNICLDPLIYFIFCKAFRAQLGLRRSVGATRAPAQALEERKTNEVTRPERKTSLSTSRRGSGWDPLPLEPGEPSLAWDRSHQGLPCGVSSTLTPSQSYTCPNSETGTDSVKDAKHLKQCHACELPPGAE